MADLARYLAAAAGVLGLLSIAGQAPGARAQTVAAVGSDAISRGAYVFRAAGCQACHSDPKRKDEPLAGGRALETPFGTFYSPNITPDREFGIGAWSDADFLRALRQGKAPDGRSYYPVFPYTAYAGMREGDILDLKAYLFAQPPIARADRAHEISFPLGFRFMAGLWKLLFFDPAPFAPDPNKDARWNRGAYLVRHLGHCRECHNQRNLFGALRDEPELAGNPKGPDGKKVPNITPHPKDGIGRWSDSDIAYFLKTGFRPDGDFAGGLMVEVIEQSTGHLSDGDRAAIVTYLRALPPVPGP